MQDDYAEALAEYRALRLERDDLEVRAAELRVSIDLAERRLATARLRLQWLLNSTRSEMTK